MSKPKKLPNVLMNNKKLPKRIKGSRVSTNIKTVAKFFYEIEGKMIKEIAKDVGVSEMTVHKWKKDFNWKPKATYLEKAEELNRIKFIQIASEKGMPPEAATQALIDGMTLPVKGVGKKAQPNYDTRHKYVHDYFQMAGLIGRTGGFEVNNDTGTVNIQVNIPDKDG